MNIGEVLAVLAVFAPLVWKLVDFAKFIMNKEWISAFTQAAAWAAGVAVSLLVWQSNFGDSVALHSLNWASIVLAGFSIASVGSALYDLKRARDNSDSAATPPLLPPRARAKAAKKAAP